MSLTTNISLNTKMYIVNHFLNHILLTTKIHDINHEIVVINVLHFSD